MRKQEGRGKVHTLTTLSQPAETMTGLRGLGEKRTHETLLRDALRSGSGLWKKSWVATDHSEWPSSLMSNLHSPRVFQSLMVRSREPETI